MVYLTHDVLSLSRFGSATKDRMDLLSFPVSLLGAGVYPLFPHSFALFLHKVCVSLYSCLILEKETKEVQITEDASRAGRYTDCQ